MKPAGGARATGSEEPARRSNSFPRRERILRRAEYQSTYDHGSKRHGRFTVAFAVPTDRGFSRIGITATRKIGKAHDRNRFKRWIRETWRTSRDQHGLDERSLDVVVNVKPAARDASFTEFSSDLVNVLRRLAADAARGA